MSMNRLMMIALAGLAVAGLGLAANVSQSPRVLVPAEPANPNKVVGNQACVKCHASEIKVWEKTPHSKTFDELHRRPEAKQIAGKLGLRSIKHDGRCVACHYTQQSDTAGNPHAIAGVSCESCHGAAKDWLDIHHDYGGNTPNRNRCPSTVTVAKKHCSRNAQSDECVLGCPELSSLSHDG